MIGRSLRHDLGRARRGLRRRLDLARVPTTTREGRSAGFRDDPHGRFWWHKLAATDYVPALYANLRRAERAVMEG